MKALRKLGKGAESVQLCEVEKPIPGPNDLLVKVMAAGICGTDLHILAEEYSHSVPVTLGHEYTGVVEQVGSGVTEGLYRCQCGWRHGGIYGNSGRLGDEST